ncbi:hypothetical protein CEXT_221851 [Caerostris extrusa]|uniref:Uncharacterized protein n=1 Tax=Caerostris extrusa TaxID=172846 RepID=A0AAV4MB49_CAEEX|nr:hypothetical protein CEXT_221851 [Caerostris extrusa]
MAFGSGSQILRPDPKGGSHGAKRGCGVMDASLMPLLANVVDIRYVAIYGTVYAIAETAVCLSYSIGKYSP